VNKKLPVSSLYYHTSHEEDNPVPKSRKLSVKMSQLPAEMSAILQFGEETTWHNRWAAHN
jgi:hypothetical protein